MYNRELENILKNVKEFIEDNKEGTGKAVFWILFYDVTQKINSSTSKKGAKNFEIEDIDESFDLLRKAIYRICEAGHKWVMVSLRNSRTDSQEVVYAFPNPLADKEQGYGIGNYGFNGGNNNSGFSPELLLKIMEAKEYSAVGNLSQIASLQNSISEMKLRMEYEEKLREKDEEISHLRYQNEKGFLNKFLTQENLMLFINALGYKVPAAAIEGTESAQHVTDVKEEKEAEETEENELLTQYKKDLERIKKHFPNIPSFFNVLANYVESDPAQAKLLFNTMKQQQAKK